MLPLMIREITDSHQYRAGNEANHRSVQSNDATPTTARVWRPQIFSVTYHVRERPTHKAYCGMQECSRNTATKRAPVKHILSLPMTKWGQVSLKREVPQSELKGADDTPLWCKMIEYRHNSSWSNYTHTWTYVRQLQLQKAQLPFSFMDQLQVPSLLGLLAKQKTPTLAHTYQLQQGWLSWLHARISIWIKRVASYTDIGTRQWLTHATRGDSINCWTLSDMVGVLSQHRTLSHSVGGVGDRDELPQPRT